jgi:hypothetical protein
MGLPSITRGVKFRDDALLASNWASSVSANVSTGSITSDGDILTVPVTFTSAVNTNQGGVGYVSFPAGILTATYPKLIVRHYDSGIGANPDFIIEVDYTDSSVQILTLTKTTSLTVETFTLNTGKIVSALSLFLKANAGLTGAFTFYLDFVFIFKETLTLPTASKAVRQRTKRRIIAIPIWGKEGDVLQDGGSDSPEYDIAGQLVTSTSGQSGWTNTYTADQWWNLLNSLMIETGTTQADGNPTWQYLVWDQGSAKVLPISFVADENPGRISNWDYQIQFKEFDVLSRASTNPLGGLLGSY